MSGAHGRAGHGSLLAQPAAVFLVDLQGGGGRSGPGLGAHEGSQDGLIPGVALGGLTQQVRGLLVLTGGLQGEGPVAADRLGLGGGALPQASDRSGFRTDGVIVPLRDERHQQLLGEVQDLVPLARGGAGASPLRPVRQVSGIDLRRRQRQSVPVADTFDDTLPHRGSHPGDDDVQRPQRPGRDLIGPQGLDESAVAHTGVRAAHEHGEQVEGPPGQGLAAPGRRIRQEGQGI